MYKKITHQIVEEHFAHPIAAELKTNVDKTKPKSEVDYLGRVLDPITHKPMIDKKTGKYVYAVKPMLHPDKKTNPKPKGYIEYYNLSPLSQVEKDSLNYFGQLAWRIRSLVISTTSGDKDIDLLKTRMAGDIDNISKIVEEVYGTDASTQFSKLLNEVTLNLVDVITLVNQDVDTTDSMKKLNDSNVALGNFLEKANSKWPSKTVSDLLSQIENLYIMQTISRMKKEWEAGVAAADNAYDIFVVKQDDGGPSLADIFSHGILCEIENKVENEYYDYMEA